MVIIEKKIDDLTKEVWEFIFMDMKLYLNKYSLMKKESSRHRKYRTIKHYDRIMRRDSNISIDEIELTNEMKKEAIDKFTQGIECVKWIKPRR